MAPILFALALLAQDGTPPPAPSDDGPVSTTQPRKQDVAPLPIQGGKVSPPADDYGYVAWCYGAVGGYVELYDKAMPEVIRIERAWPTPSTEENISVVYPQQKRDAMKSLELYKRAIVAAEKASPTSIATQGAAAIKKGRGVWTGATTVPKAQLAQFWMSWAPPAKCDETAAALEKKATLFGSVLNYNTEVAATAQAAPAAPAASPTAPDATPDVTLAETPTLAPPAEVARAETAGESPTPAPDVPAVTEETPAPATEDTPSEGESAIDALLPSLDTMETATAAAPEPAAAPEAPPAVETPAAKPEPATAPKAAPEPAKPEKPKTRKKPGLRDTLKGMRGPV